MREHERGHWQFDFTAAHFYLLFYHILYIRIPSGVADQWDKIDLLRT